MKYFKKYKKDMSNNIQYLLCWYIPFKMGSSQNCLTNSSIYRPVPFNIEVKKFQYHRTYLDIAESFFSSFSQYCIFKQKNAFVSAIFQIFVQI